MFHEVSYPFRRHQPVRHQVIGMVNRVMATLVAAASERVFVSIPKWIPILSPLAVTPEDVIVLPIPSNLPTHAAPTPRLAEGAIIGHFGTYGPLIAQMLDTVLPPLLEDRNRHVLLMGNGSERYAQRLGDANVRIRTRIHATGGLPADQLASHLASCDLLLQIYPDGLSGRRGTVMAGLALGVPVVSNLGELSEAFWAGSKAIALAASNDPMAIVAQAERTLADESLRRELAARGRALYAERFDIERTIDTLLRLD